MGLAPRPAGLQPRDGLQRELRDSLGTGFAIRV